MKVRITIAVVAGIVAIGVWTVLASRLFVWMGGLGEYFPSPWITWWRYARQSRIGGSTMIYLIASGLVTAVPILLVVLVVVLSLRSGSSQPDLWGKTGFATRREMERGGIKTKGKLF